MQKQPLFSAQMISGAGAWTFTMHEGLRVIVPGFYFATLLLLFYVSYLWRLFPVALPSGMAGILFLFVTAVAGLTMYAKESPKRRKAFVENQPSKYLLTKSRTAKSGTPLTDDDARRLYFYLLNNHMPPAFHEKVFFFGTVYHTMILIRRTSFWFSVVALVAVALNLAQGIPLADQQALALFTISVLMIYILNVRHNKADRKMQENYQDQIFWLQMNNELVDGHIRVFRSAPQRP